MGEVSNEVDMRLEEMSKAVEFSLVVVKASERAGAEVDDKFIVAGGPSLTNVRDSDATVELVRVALLDCTKVSREAGIVLGVWSGAEDDLLDSIVVPIVVGMAIEVKFEAVEDISLSVGEALDVKFELMDVKISVDRIDVLEEPDVAIEDEFCAVERSLRITRLEDSVETTTADEFCALSIPLDELVLSGNTDAMVEDESLVVDMDLGTVPTDDEFWFTIMSVFVVKMTEEEEETVEDTGSSVEKSKVALGVPEAGRIVELTLEANTVVLEDED